jgi:hypothetical protein
MDEERPQPPAGRYGGHTRNESDASVTTILAEKPQQPVEYGYSDTSYPPQRQPTYTNKGGSVSRRPTLNDPYAPPNAFTQAPAPTPQAYDYNYSAYPNQAQGYNDPYYGASGYAGGSGNGNVAAPGPAQPHPGM